MRPPRLVRSSTQESYRRAGAELLHLALEGVTDLLDAQGEWGAGGGIGPQHAALGRVDEHPVGAVLEGDPVGRERDQVTALPTPGRSGLRRCVGCCVGRCIGGRTCRSPTGTG